MTEDAGQLEGEGPDRRAKARPSVALDCEIRVATRAWRRSRITDLTPGGFQVTILDMPARGTPVFVRMAGLQMLQAQVRWTKVETAGCQFDRPLAEYTFDHILAHIGKN